VTSAGFRGHGGPPHRELAELGLCESDIVDFSSNTNVYGPSPGVLAAVRSASVDRYPDSSTRAAREALARAFDEEAERIVLGNGAADLLWTLARVLVSPGATALVVEPTFCEFGVAAEAIGAKITRWRASPETGFAIDLEAIAELAASRRAAVVYLCSPNTPTGVSVPAEAVAGWARSNPQLWLVLDQSFLSLSDRADDLRVPMPPNVIRVRSLTKDHALAGVRVGYAITTPQVVANVEAQRPAWTVSSIAQTAAIATCEHLSFVADSRKRLLADCKALREALIDVGLSPLASSTVFLIAPLEQVALLRRRLLKEHRIHIRDCASFGLPGYVRLAARPKPDRERLVRALREELRRC
jgi:histidinol-phosphate/aromatic aminotransferase/cobyric acid decarboxylase-like protein